MITPKYQNGLDCFSIFSLSSAIPFSLRVFHIIQLLLDHLDPTLVDHLSPYLNTRPIKHPFQPSVSCSSQGSTVQKFSSHKCDQKNNCNAFNAVVAVFPQIFRVSFLLVHSQGTFSTYLDYICRIRGGIPPRTSFYSYPTCEISTENSLVSIHSSLDLSMSSDKT